MFPYADYKDDYWTGFYSSRPNLKEKISDGSSYLMASSRFFAYEQIDVNRTKEDYSNLFKANNQLSDAVAAL